MKPHIAKEIIKNVKDRGYVLIDNVFYPPNSAHVELFYKSNGNAPYNRKGVLKTLKTGWVDDGRNIRNKTKYTDEFIHLMKIALNVEIWPEFYFHTSRGFRIDYAIPVYGNLPVKIAIEQEGGLFMKKSGHNTGKGIQRDMEKNNLLVSEGWTLIRREPKDLKINNSAETIEIIRKVLTRKITV